MHVGQCCYVSRPCSCCETRDPEARNQSLSLTAWAVGCPYKMHDLHTHGSFQWGTSTKLGCSTWTHLGYMCHCTGFIQHTTQASVQHSFMPAFLHHAQQQLTDYAGGSSVLCFCSMVCNILSVLHKVCCSAVLTQSRFQATWHSTGDQWRLVPPGTA